MAPRSMWCPRFCRHGPCSSKFCPECGEPLAGVFLVASTALVALLFEIKIFNAESEEHAGRIAKSSIGRALGAIPLRVLETNPID